MLKELNERQADVRELLAHLREESDKTVEEGLAGNLGYHDEVVIATVLAVKEMATEPDYDVSTIDLIWAGAFLDHLDTQGFEVVYKMAPMKQLAEPPQILRVLETKKGKTGGKRRK